MALEFQGAPLRMLKKIDYIEGKKAERRNRAAGSRVGGLAFVTAPRCPTGPQPAITARLQACTGYTRHEKGCRLPALYLAEIQPKEAACFRSAR